MYAQLVHVRRDVAAPHFGGQRGLLEREERCGERADVVRGLELLARLQPLPRAGDLDADARGVHGGVDVFKERHDTAGARHRLRGAVRVEWVGLDVHEACKVGVDLQGEEDVLIRSRQRAAQLFFVRLLRCSFWKATHANLDGQRLQLHVRILRTQVLRQLGCFLEKLLVPMLL